MKIQTQKTMLSDADGVYTDRSMISRNNINQA